MAIDQNKGELTGIESFSGGNAFHHELQTERQERMSPEALRCAEMLRENDLMVEKIKAHAFSVADNVSSSLNRLPESVQRDFINHIAQFNGKHDLVYDRVRENYENKQS